MLDNTLQETKMDNILPSSINHEIQGNFISQQKLKNLEDRLWMDSTLSKFDEVLRINYDKSIEVFADIVIAETCEIVQAISGSFFVVDDEQKIFAKAGYGCTLATMPKTSFMLGEGIIGQVAKSKATRHISNIPTQSIRISTSLGQINACSLICLPLIFNEKVYGIIELISLNIFETRFVDFLERLSKNIASTLQSIQTNIKTKELLIKLQQETEQRAAQEEELRQNLEELQSTQEHTYKQQQELEILKENLEIKVKEQTIALNNALQRFDLATKSTTEGLWDMVVPENLLIEDSTPFWWSDTLRNLLGYKDEQDFPNILSSWSNLLHADHKEMAINAFNHHLFDYSGKTSYDIEYQLLCKNGQYRWFQAVGNTLRDGKGRPLRVAGALIDIQNEKELALLNNKLQKETELKAAQEQILRRSYEKSRALQDKAAAQAEQFNDLVDGLPGMLYQFLLEVDTQTMMFTYVSKQSEGLFGKTPKEMENKMLLDIFAEDMDKFAQTVAHSAQHLSHYSIDIRLKIVNGEYAWFNAESKPKKLDNGNILWSGYMQKIDKK
jgi:PAS domain-containing protein